MIHNNDMLPLNSVPKISLRVDWGTYGYCNTCARRLPELGTAKLGPGAVLVLRVRSVAVVWGV